jgi:ornithine cyclodeaminase/alanine dehydrogenase-like protein (mu-crystallin family)
VIIDSKAQFPHEARDVTSQVEKGLITWDQIAELHEVVAGDKKGRESDQEITLLKTVGTPLQDLLPAAKVYTLAVEREVGTNLGDVFPPAVSWLKQIEEVPS